MKISDEAEKMLFKRAMGYTAKETTEEYVVEDGVKRLVKQKVCKKQVPADLSALKYFLESGEEVLSDDELAAERERLLEELEKRRSEKP